jgi:hypothetical protein
LNKIQPPAPEMIIDLCFYAESDFDLFLSLNKWTGKTRQYRDSEGYHIVFQPTDFPTGATQLTEIKDKSGKVIGQWKPCQ